jgi:putative hemolysin
MIVVELIVIGLLVMLSGFFSAAETALFSITRFKVRSVFRQKKPGSASLLALKKDVPKMLITLLLVTTFINIIASIWAADLASRTIRYQPLTIATGVMTFILLLFGEIIPKSIGASNAEKISLLVAFPVRVMKKVLTPLIWIFELVTIKLLRIKHKASKITEDDIKSFIDIAREEGGIDKQESELMHKIFSFTDIKVKDIMVQINYRTSLSDNDALIDAFDAVRYFKHKIIPVYELKSKKIIGIFHLNDALGHLQKSDLIMPVSQIMKKPFFLSPDQEIDDALRLMQKRKEKIAIVIDKTGKHIGLVTVDDIIEQIIGDLK